ncbi:hypothetical protein GO986_09940 [Deinococcus sp. HMF7620]|uniref:SHOCT domain-containing protein n=1 Tax=Deinococcus arboris TaxID=2682977 RepID=A0A7C9HYL1_9DEIO|nr:SHOCT domain-containing protein [Deinococcus arboris]MVN87088.1 hypothetical protein [Deinococcus arboris]
MDIFVNNAPAQAVPQTYLPLQGVPYGYGPLSAPRHDGPPGFLLVALGIGAFLFLRRRRLHRFGGPGQMPEEVRHLRETFRQGRSRFMTDQAQQIARERYAKGEINADEYEALRRTLSGEHKPGQSGQPEAEGDLKL